MLYSWDMVWYYVNDENTQIMSTHPVVYGVDIYIIWYIYIWDGPTNRSTNRGLTRKITKYADHVKETYIKKRDEKDFSKSQEHHLIAVVKHSFLHRHLSLPFTWHSILMTLYTSLHLTHLGVDGVPYFSTNPPPVIDSSNRATSLRGIA